MRVILLSGTKQNSIKVGYFNGNDYVNKKYVSINSIINPNAVSRHEPVTIARTSGMEGQVSNDGSKNAYFFMVTALMKTKTYTEERNRGYSHAPLFNRSHLFCGSNTIDSHDTAVLSE
jgi:hypothetical protein